MSDTATTAKRSLYEPEGFPVSTLKYKWFKPKLGPIRRERTSGVFPSPKEIRHAGGMSAIHCDHRQIDMFVARCPEEKSWKDHCTVPALCIGNILRIKDPSLARHASLVLSLAPKVFVARWCPLRRETSDVAVG